MNPETPKVFVLVESNLRSREDLYGVESSATSLFRRHLRLLWSLHTDYGVCTGAKRYGEMRKRGPMSCLSLHLSTEYRTMVSLLRAQCGQPSSLLRPEYEKLSMTCTVGMASPRDLYCGHLVC